MSFINRTNERSEICSTVNQVNDNNCVIVLFGSTGVGKSGLAQHLLNNELNSLESIRVHVSKSSPDSIESSHYLNTIYREICNYAKRNISRVISPAEHAMTNPSNIFRLAKEWLKNKAGLPESSKLYEPVYEPSLVQKKDYIIEILKPGHYILNIDNIQNIDVVSLEILFEIIKSITNTIFVFEYTTESGNNEDLLNFINEINIVCTNTHSYSIEKLPFSEAKNLAPSSIQVDDSVLYHIYENSNGNLMQIILANQLINEQSNSIQTTLSSLDKNEKYIIFLLYWNEGKISKENLTMMMSYNYATDAYIMMQNQLEQVVNSLLEKKVINQNSQGDYEITHDSIIEELNRISLNPQLLIAYNVIKNYLLEQLSSFPDDASIVDSLFSLFIKLRDEDLILILPKIQRIISRSKYPQNAITKLKFYQSKMDEQGVGGLHTSSIIYEQLAAICNELGLFQYAQEFLNHVYQPSDFYHVALQASIYGWQCDCESISELIESYNDKSRKNLLLRLCKLIAAMMSKPRKESLDIALSLLEDYANSYYFEYAYLLRNYAELVDDSYEAITLYEKCIDIFNRFNRKELVAEIHLSLSMIYAYNAELDEARNHLIIANELNDMINESCLLNNHAAVDILSGDTSDNVQKKLSDALLINGNEYDRLIIKCNLLICYIKSHKKEHAKDLCQQIEESDYEKYQYDEFLHIIYVNLLYYYQSASNQDKINYYIDKLKDILLRDSTSKFNIELINSLIYGTSSEEFYAQFPYRVDFLGYWVFRIEPSLKHC